MLVPETIFSRTRFIILMIRYAPKDLMRSVRKGENDLVLRNQEDKYYMEAKTMTLGHEKAFKFSLAQESH